MKLFALTSGHHFRLKASELLASQAFLEQTRHVIDVQANLMLRNKVMAEYWADGPKSELPPGHRTLFAAYVADRDLMNLTETVCHDQRGV